MSSRSVADTISSSQFEIFNKLLGPLETLDATAFWAANQRNVPMASPAPGYQQGSPARSDYESDYSCGNSSPEYFNNFQTSFLQALENPVYLEQQNSQKGCFGGDIPELIDIAAFMSGDGPDTDLLMNCIDELEELKENEANFAFSSCLPKSPGLSSCDDGYNSGIESDGLEVSSNATGSPAPVEAIPEDAFSDYAPSPKPEEIQVVPASPSQTPRAKQSKLPHTPGRRKRGPRSLTLNNGNGPMQLWQFLLMILTQGPKGLVQWTHDEPFEFKLLNPNKVASMWGEVKNKPSMNYEKLSRGLRYYYGKKILEKVHGKRYVYQFQCDIPKILGYDPTATDPKQNVEDAVCDSPDISDAASDTSEECPPSVSSEDSVPECWEFAPGLW